MELPSSGESSPTKQLEKENVYLTWKNLNLYYDHAPLAFVLPKALRIKGQVQQILNNCTGYAKSGEMIALIGPSGSGKSSLLNVLA
jgi:ABC-type multidrug transport system ATPase subunit